MPQEEANGSFNCIKCCNSQLHSRFMDVHVVGKGPQKELNVRENGDEAVNFRVPEDLCAHSSSCFDGLGAERVSFTVQYNSALYGLTSKRTPTEPRTGVT